MKKKQRKGRAAKRPNPQMRIVVDGKVIAALVLDQLLVGIQKVTRERGL